MSRNLTGTLRRGPTPNTVEGELRDQFGPALLLTGTRQPDGSYTLTARPAPIPPELALPDGFEVAE